MEIIGNDKAQKELIPIGKLKDFLMWREKEFIEKYDSVRYNTENDSYSSLEAELENGRPLVAIVNSTLLEWDRKASKAMYLLTKKHVNKIEISFEIYKDKYWQMFHRFIPG